MKSLPSIGLGLGLDPAASQPFSGAQDFSTYSTNASSFLSNQQTPSFSQPGLADPSSAFDLPSQGFNQQLKDDDPSSFGAQTQGGYAPGLLASNFAADADFTIFPRPRESSRTTRRCSLARASSATRTIP